MKSHSWPTVLGAMLLSVLMVAAGCGGDTASDPAPEAGVSTVDQQGGNGQDTDQPDADQQDSDQGPASDSGRADSTGAGTGPGDPEANTQNMVRALFNIDMAPEQVDCMLDESQDLPGLDQAIADNAALFSDFDDDQLRDISYGIARCADPIALGAWATQAVGPQGEVATTAPECFGERFSAEDGPGVFHTFVALSFQYRYDPDHITSMRDALVSCTPVVALHEFFAQQHEAVSGMIVDRDCLRDALNNTTASEEFWGALIDGLQSPATAVDPYLDGCSELPDADLAPEVPADFEPWSGTGALAEVAPSARNHVYDQAPPMVIDPSLDYEAVLATGGGEIRIRLFAADAPVTVNNFVSLARDGFYDRTVFHRVLDGFMAQGGDPTGTGTGGPGYAFEDEFDSPHAFDVGGLLAMANSGPATNGSQFFITFAPTEHLTGSHTIFGEVVSGDDIVAAIERRDPGAPSGRGQVLESVKIIESEPG